jgi:predicted nucleic acid-binding protein
MSGSSPDTSCIIPAVSPWHEHHELARIAINDYLNRSERLIVAASALVEGYSVLTRLPMPYRLAPSDALTLLQANFMEEAEVVSLDAECYLDLLARAPQESIVGGRIYDAIIAECALQADATVLLTFNARHFAPYTGRGLTIVVPGKSE